MHDLHISPQLLLGRHISHINGGRKIIAAVWMENQANEALRPNFVVLGIDQDGTCIKVTLPNIDWKFEPFPEAM